LSILKITTITSPLNTISVAGTIGGDDQTVDVNFSTTFTDDKAVKASDLASVANGKGASIIGSEDAGGYFVGVDVEAILQEIGDKINEFGNTYTVGAPGVTKGDLVFISANDTVSTYSVLTNAEVCIGLAATTESTSSQVKVLANDTIVQGILSGASAGDRYFWTGTGWSTTQPVGTGKNVYRGGAAKNGTDMQVEVKHIRKRS